MTPFLVDDIPSEDGRRACGITDGKSEAIDGISVYQPELASAEASAQSEPPPPEPP